MNNTFKNIAIWLAIVMVMLTIFNLTGVKNSTDNQVVYSQFMQEVKAGQIAKVQIDGRVVRGTTHDGKKFSTYAPSDIWLVSDLLENNVVVEAKPDEEQSLFVSILVSWFPMILLIGVWIFFMRQMQGGGKGGGPFSFGKSKARQLDETNNSTTLSLIHI